MAHGVFHRAPTQFNVNDRLNTSKSIDVNVKSVGGAESRVACQEAPCDSH